MPNLDPDGEPQQGYLGDGEVKKFRLLTSGIVKYKVVDTADSPNPATLQVFGPDDNRESENPFTVPAGSHTYVIRLRADNGGTTYQVAAKKVQAASAIREVASKKKKKKKKTT